MKPKKMSLIPSDSTTQRTPGRASTSRSKRARALAPMPSVSRRTRLPAIPMLITARGGMSCRAASRRASNEGHGVSASGVVPVRRSMESPRATMVAAVGSAQHVDAREPQVGLERGGVPQVLRGGLVAGCEPRRAQPDLCVVGLTSRRGCAAKRPDRSARARRTRWDRCRCARPSATPPRRARRRSVRALPARSPRRPRAARSARRRCAPARDRRSSTARRARPCRPRWHAPPCARSAR